MRPGLRVGSAHDMRNRCCVAAEAGKGGVQVAQLGSSPARTGCSIAQGDSPMSTSSRLSFRVEEGTPLQNGARERTLRRTASSEGAEAHSGGLHLNGSMPEAGSIENGLEASSSGAGEGHALEDSSSAGLRGKSSPMPAAQGVSHALMVPVDEICLWQYLQCNYACMYGGWVFCCSWHAGPAAKSFPRCTGVIMEDASHDMRASGSLRDAAGTLLLQRKGLAQRMGSLPLPECDGDRETERLVGDIPVCLPCTRAWHMGCNSDLWGHCMVHSWQVGGLCRRLNRLHGGRRRTR